MAAFRSDLPSARAKGPSVFQLPAALQVSVRHWLLVREARTADVTQTDWFAEFAPIPDELTAHDRVAMVAWPVRGPVRWPVLDATASVTALDPAARRLRLRRRVNAITGHEIGLNALDARVSATRGWTPQRRPELLGAVHLITERDFEHIEEALLEVAHRYGPPPKRRQHAHPRTPGRRALSAGRASVSGSRRGVR